MADMVTFRHKRNGTLSTIPEDHPMVPEMDAGERWERVQAEKPKASAKPAAAGPAK